MKKIISIIMLACIACNFVSAQTARETIKERKQIARYSESELNSKASKAAKKEGKQLKKAGWVVAPGHLPLEKQLDRSYQMYYEFEANGLPKYIVGDAMSIGDAYDAAKMQAIELAKTNLAGMIQTEITALIESTVGNEQLSQQEAASVVSTVQASKNLIVQRLGRTITTMECYRILPNKAVEVRVSLAYNSKMAMDAAKEIIKQQLEEKGEDLHKQLDALWSQFGN